MPASITFVTIFTRYRDSGREAEGQRSLSVILTTMYLVLGGAIVVAEIFAPWYIHWWFNGFDAEKAALCVKLTRILLPAQLFFFAGGVFGAVLLVRKQFNVQAVSPLIYNLGTIVGGMLLVKAAGRFFSGHRHGGGSVCGPFLLNCDFARRAGTRYRPMLDWHDEGLRDWVRLSLPLIVGVSLVTADSWIIAHFASSDRRRGFADELRQAALHGAHGGAGAGGGRGFHAVFCQPVGAGETLRVCQPGGRFGVARGLPGTVGCFGDGFAGLPAGRPDLRGRTLFGRDARECAAYFAVFSVSMFLWSAQAIYARAFYAAGNTFAPMAAGTVVTRDFAARSMRPSSVGTARWAWPLLRTSGSLCRR